MDFATLDGKVLDIMRNSHVWVPSPLAMSPGKEGILLEKWQKLLTDYYCRAGAATVIAGAHTGQFARYDLGLYAAWLQLVNEVTQPWVDSGKMFRMAAVGGPKAIEMAKIAKEQGQDIVMVAPSAIRGYFYSLGNPDEDGAIEYLKEMAATIPVFGFYLQTAVGGIPLEKSFWHKLFDFAYGAKAAPFDRYKTDDVMIAAVECDRWDELVLATGNDDFIVGDLLNRWKFKDRELYFTAGLLGHFATDTFSANNLVAYLKSRRASYQQQLAADPSCQDPEIIQLAADVTDMNRALFDDKHLPNKMPFDYSVRGVHHRLWRLGLMPMQTGIVWPDGRVEEERPGLGHEIGVAYNATIFLSRERLVDDNFVLGVLPQLKQKYKVG